MFSPYSPAFDSDPGRLSFVGTAGLAIGVVAPFVLAASGGADEHAFNQIIKNTISALAPSAAVFHQSRGSRPSTVFIVLLPFSPTPPSFHLNLLPDSAGPKCNYLQESCQFWRNAKLILFFFK